MLGFFAKKGILLKKIRSYGSIIRSINMIRKERKIIQEKRVISDDEVLKNFCCDMYIPPESEESEHMKSFNRILIRLGKVSGFYQKVKTLE